MEYRNGEGIGRSDDRLAARDRARDRDRGDQRGYDPRVTVDRYDGRDRDSGANRYAEPSRYRLGRYSFLFMGCSF